MDNNIKAVNLDEVDKSLRPKQKVILFEQFHYSKGGRLRYRIRQLFWDFRYAIDRALYGYEPTAVFSMDTVFVERYTETLKQFKNGHSFPGNMTYDEWQETIQKMIDLLAVMGMDEWSFAVEDGKGSYDWEAMKAFSKTKVDAKNEFFELFSLYFFDLWD